MSREVVTVPADVSVLEAARVMTQRRLKRLPVVDTTGYLLGIVSRVASGFVADRIGTGLMIAAW